MGDRSQDINFSELLDKVVQHPPYSRWVRGEEDGRVAYRNPGKNPHLKLTEIGLYDFKAGNLIKNLIAIAKEVGVHINGSVSNERVGAGGGQGYPNGTGEPSSSKASTGVDLDFVAGNRVLSGVEVDQSGVGSQGTTEVELVEKSDAGDLPEKVEAVVTSAESVSGSGEDKGSGASDAERGEGDRPAADSNSRVDTEDSGSGEQAASSSAGNTRRGKPEERGLRAERLYNNAKVLSSEKVAAFEIVKKYFESRCIEFSVRWAESLGIRFLRYKTQQTNAAGQVAAGEIVIPARTPSGQIVSVCRIVVDTEGRKFVGKDKPNKLTFGSKKDSVDAGFGDSFACVVGHKVTANLKAGDFRGGLFEGCRNIYVFEGIEDALTFRQHCSDEQRREDLLLVTFSANGMNRLKWWIEQAAARNINWYFFCDPDSDVGSDGFCVGVKKAVFADGVGGLPADSDCWKRDGGGSTGKLSGLYYLIPGGQYWRDGVDINSAAIMVPGVGGGLNDELKERVAVELDRYLSNLSIFNRNEAELWVLEQLNRKLQLEGRAQKPIPERLAGVLDAANTEPIDPAANRPDGTENRDGGSEQVDRASDSPEARRSGEATQDARTALGADQSGGGDSDAEPRQLSEYEEHRDFMIQLFPGGMRRELLSRSLFIRRRPADNWEQIDNYEDYIKGMAYTEREIEFDSRGRPKEVDKYKPTKFKPYWNRYCVEELEPMLTLDIPEWDGRDRVREVTDFIVEEEFTADEVYELFRSWLVRSWQRIWNSEIQNNFLIMTGAQGAGKDGLINALTQGFGGYRGNLNLDQKKLQIYRDASRLIIANISEVDQYRRQEQALIKDIVTTEKLEFDQKWVVGTVDEPSRISLIGTSNEDDILNDWTGNRRYWILKVKDILLQRVSRRNPKPNAPFPPAKKLHHYPGDLFDPLRDDNRLQIVAQVKAMAEKNPEFADISNELYAKMEARVVGMTPDNPTFEACDVWEIKILEYVRKKAAEEMSGSVVDDAFSSRDGDASESIDESDLDEIDDDFDWETGESVARVVAETHKWRWVLENNTISAGDCSEVLREVSRDLGWKPSSVQRALKKGGYKMSHAKYFNGKKVRTAYRLRPQRSV